MLTTGSCLCGAVRFEVQGEPTFVVVCHCNSCRKASGGAMVPWATFQASNTRFEGDALVEYHSSPGVTRGHCGRCGSNLSYRHELRSGEIDLTLECLDDPAAFAPTAHIWVVDKLPWLVIADGLPQYRRTISAA